MPFNEPNPLGGEVANLKRDLIKSVERWQKSEAEIERLTDTIRTALNALEFDNIEVAFEALKKSVSHQQEVKTK